MTSSVGVTVPRARAGRKPGREGVRSPIVDCGLRIDEGRTVFQSAIEWTPLPDGRASASDPPVSARGTDLLRHRGAPVTQRDSVRNKKGTAVSNTIPLCNR